MASQLVFAHWKAAASAPVQLAVRLMGDLLISRERTAYLELERCARAYAEAHSAASPGEIEGVQIARRLFRSIGVDPTRRRPSSEALLNRALKSKPLPAINTLVDTGNWCSLEFLLPICVYDAENIVGRVTVRLGAVEETYIALDGRSIHLNGRYVLADELGPFGSPILDSQRTAVSESTKNAILGLYAPAEYDPAQLERLMDLFSERVGKICGGRVIESAVLGGTAAGV